MNKHRKTVKKSWKYLGLRGCLVLFCAPATAQGEGYVPPPSGPYQSSAVVIERSDDSSNSEHQVYRFPPSNILVPEVEPRRFREIERQPKVETQDIPRPPSAHQIPAAPRQQPTPPEPWTFPNYSTAPQAYPGSQNWYGYQGGVWQQPAPGYGYYPYAVPQQYPQQYSPFDNMPSPWSVIPNNPFSRKE